MTIVYVAAGVLASVALVFIGFAIGYSDGFTEGKTAERDRVYDLTQLPGYDKRRRAER